MPRMPPPSKTRAVSSTLRRMASFRERLLHNGIALRARRAAALLRRTLEDLDSALRDTDGGEPLSTVLRQSARIRELQDAQRWVSAEISSVRNEWKRELAPWFSPRWDRGENHGRVKVAAVSGLWRPAVGHLGVWASAIRG